MPIDLCSTVNSASHFAFGSSTLNKIFGSSIFVAVVIALVMLLLVMIMYPAKPGTGVLLLFKMFLYMFFGSLIVVFLHDSVLKHMFEENHTANVSSDFMRGTIQKDPAYGDSHYEVKPTLGSGENHNDNTTGTTGNGKSIVVEEIKPDTKEVTLEFGDLPSSVVMGGGVHKLGGVHAPSSNVNPYS